MKNKANLKLNYMQIGVEITRKCNMKCKHCMRGEAQNHTISKKVIDKFLDNIGSIVSLILTGGEPFIEPEIISYLFDEIIRRKIRILSFSCVTNGSILSESIAESWNKLSKYIAENFSEYLDNKEIRTIGRITVSNDKFHDVEEPMNTVKFYRSLLNEYCICMKEKPEPDERIIMLGRAKQNEEIRNSKNVIYRVCPYRLEMNDMAVLTCIFVGWDGKICIGDDCSFEQQDKCNYGNIMNSHLTDLMVPGFKDEMFIEEESQMYNMIYTILKTEDFHGVFTKDFCENILKYFEYVFGVRNLVSKTYPFLSFDEVIEIAYDDINVKQRKTNNDTKIIVIKDLKEYDKSIEDSQKNCNDLKERALKNNPKNYISNIVKGNKTLVPLNLKEWS